MKHCYIYIEHESYAYACPMTMDEIGLALSKPDVLGFSTLNCVWWTVENSNDHEAENTYSPVKLKIRPHRVTSYIEVSPTQERKFLRAQGLLPDIYP